MDRIHLAACPKPAHPRENAEDYIRTVVRKPWGYEYLLYQNPDAAVWVLHLKAARHRTSFHCHPKKKTSLIVLAGTAECSTLGRDPIALDVGDGLSLERGVFHSTRATAPEGTIVIETETPTDKGDLVRMDDAYGRHGQGYEGSAHLVAWDDSLPHFHGPDQRHHTIRRIGRCNLALIPMGLSESMPIRFADRDIHLVTILQGRVEDGRGERILTVGDTLTGEEIRSNLGLRAGAASELLIVQL